MGDINSNGLAFASISTSIIDRSPLFLCGGAQGKHFQTVTYINSTAAVKALSDWIVTSGTEEIIKRVPEEYEILFAPDQHLGQYLQEVTGRKMTMWKGSCMVHEIFSVMDLLILKRRFPHYCDDNIESVEVCHDIVL